MSKKEQATQETTIDAKVFNAEYDKLKKSLQSLVDSGIMSADDAEKQLAKIARNARQPVAKEVSDLIENEVLKVLGSASLKSKIKLLGSEYAFGVDVRVKDGEITVKVKRKNTSYRRSSGATGKRPKIALDGNEYPNVAALCKAYGVEVRNDSAPRVWDRHHRKDPDAYPMYEEIFADD